MHMTLPARLGLRLHLLHSDLLENHVLDLEHDLVDVECLIANLRVQHLDAGLRDQDLHMFLMHKHRRTT